MNLNSLFHKSRPVISLFTSKSPSSKSVLELLKKEELKRQESGRGIVLEVTDEPPTSTQLHSILEIVGTDNVGDIVDGAVSESDALRIIKSDKDAVKRPITVDWANARVVMGHNESKILSLLKKL